MVTTAAHRRKKAFDRHRLSEYGWSDLPVMSSYTREDELLDRLERLPTPEEIEDLIARLQVSLLREMSVQILNGSIVLAKGGERLEYIRSLTSWIATAEETVVAGRRLGQILSRRKKGLVHGATV